MENFKGFVPSELIDAIKANKCILFVGAGFSSKVKRSNGKNIPNWKDFLLELLSYIESKKVNFSGNSNEIREMISNGNLLMSAQELQETIDRHDFGNFLQTLFRDKDVKPSKTHLLLPTIPFRCILTSNYDNLIEGAYTIADGGRIPNKFTHEDVLNVSSPLRKDDFYIFKIHGDFDRPNTVVLGSRDYQKLFFHSPGFRQFIETLFSVYTILFIGYGASDPDLDNVLDKLSTVFERTIDKHYILLPNGRFNFTEKKRLLLDKRIEVIEYEVDKEHSQVDAFIEKLSDVFSNSKRPKGKSKPYDVFLSHSTKDDSIANKIIEQLEERNYKVWNFKENFRLGDVWQDTLSQALNESRFMIFLITDNYSTNDSNWLAKEFEIGLLRQVEGKIRVLPIVIGDTKIDRLPSDLSNIVYLRLNKNFVVEDLYPLFDILQPQNE